MFIDDYTFSVKVYILPYILPIIHIALLGSIYSTVALAAERYITICHPFMRYRCALKKKILGVPRTIFFEHFPYYYYRSYYRGTTFILPVVLFAFLYTIPKFFELRLSWKPVGNTTQEGAGNESIIVEIPKLEATAMRKDKTYIRVYLICMNFLVQIIIPFAILIGFNWLTYRTMKESEKTLLQNIRVHYQSNRNRSTRNSETGENVTIQNGQQSIQNAATLTKNKATSLRKREVILSRISIYIVFVFLFCHSVRIIPNIYEMICTYTKVSWKVKFDQLLAKLNFSIFCSLERNLYHFPPGFWPLLT